MERLNSAPEDYPSSVFLSDDYLDGIPEYQYNMAQNADAPEEIATQMPNLSKEVIFPEHQEISSKELSQSFLQDRLRDFAAFAKDSSLLFACDPAMETFAFSPTENKVYLPTSWFQNEQYNNTELTFAVYHELSHFTDMRKNPDAYLQNFDDMEVIAKRSAKEYKAKTGSQTSQAVLKNIYHQEIHKLFNCLDDIYVNNLVKQKSPRFERGDQDEVVSLYKKAGFENGDMQDHPMHDQMVFSLLRDEMLGSELGNSQVSLEVEAILSKKIMGRSMRDIIKEDLRPHSGILVDPKERYDKIKAFILPRYLELLAQDIQKEEEQQQQNQKNQDQSGQSGESGKPDNSENSEEKSESEQSNESGESGESGESEESSGSKEDGSTSEGKPRGLSDNPFSKEQEGQTGSLLDSANKQAIRDILDQFKEQDRIDSMSPQERANYLDQKRQEAFDQKYGITPKQRKDYERSMSAMKEPRKKMLKFWRGLIGKSIEERRVTIKRQRKGRLNVGDYIDDYAQIQSDLRSGITQQPEIYDRQTSERVPAIKPEEIEVTLLIDGSRSMDNEKIRAAKDTAALVMQSIIDFNEELDATRRETKSKLRANTEVIMFGSDYEVIKNFEKKTGSRNYNKNQAETIAAISKINSSYGLTNDAAPINAVSASISDQDLERIKSGELIKIFFEVTDGKPDNLNATTAAVKRLIDQGVIVSAFQIGSTSEDEQKTFNAIWNTNQSEEHGINIGTEVHLLPERLIETLRDKLKGIKI